MSKVEAPPLKTQTDLAKPALTKFWKRLNVKAQQISDIELNASWTAFQYALDYLSTDLLDEKMYRARKKPADKDVRGKTKPDLNLRS